MPNITRTAIVTGASKGIGAAISRRLAADGYSVLVNFAHGREAAEAVVRDIEAGGGRAIPVGADIAAPKGLRSLFDAAEQAFGPVGMLVNNAGIMRLGAVAEFDDEAFAVQVATNLGGVFRGMREGARRIADGGRIVSFSSSVVGLYPPGYAVYAATKAAVEAMTHVLAKELGPRRITVNAVAPGPVATELFLADKSDVEVAAAARMNPFGRLGEPEDIARIVAFLGSEESGWINGQVIRANGGVI
jgi:3-oxoacyl-[acyl-carrier protein] reductase